MNVKIVNVASVKKLSPFRYPGGKTWLVPYARAWMRSLTKEPTVFVEPFLGGGIISLTVGFEKLAKSVVMTELDHEVAAVWETILGPDCEWLVEQILSFEMTADNVRLSLASDDVSTRAIAFRTILKNRTFHGGILAAGSGLIKHGESGKGVLSRWYPQTLANRLRDIQAHREAFEFSQGDGLKAMQKHAKKSRAAFFIDPPYTAGRNGKRAGKRLYNHNELDHEKLFRLAGSLKGDFLMTYDNDEEVKELARQFGFDTDMIPMKNTHHAEMTELIIGRNLDWARRLLRSKRTLFDHQD